ncbi:pyramid forming protein [Sulfolobus islandicus rod-shaped virus 1]|uniref:Uncharacterized protein 98 n=1 Tax=Sulfolobus islandicus rod-shaped virus 1 TaxID=157898 RepID=Y98_SIRV1|nr:pyramid forming protein [Sulfolobus islandicus rod-shaped virus 1]Q8QL14.1 RecName: Full=Uncharacterized protein 98 [Sulfolobus islandicus rod-shaped virus 1]CAC93997.1 hypothetical protein [Sulfolobus islandicus rod-shaped virus 1]
MAITLLEGALYGFFAVTGVLIASFIIGEIVHLYNEKQSNENFAKAIDQMSKSTVTAIESIKDTTVTGINALLNMDTLRDVNSLAREKAKDQNPSSQAK